MHSAKVLIEQNREKNTIEISCAQKHSTNHNLTNTRLHTRTKKIVIIISAHNAPKLFLCAQSFQFYSFSFNYSTTITNIRRCFNDFVWSTCSSQKNLNSYQESDCI